MKETKINLRTYQNYKKTLQALAAEASRQFGHRVTLSAYINKLIEDHLSETSYIETKGVRRGKKLSR